MSKINQEEVLVVQAGKGKFKIKTIAIIVGADIVVVSSGGEIPHVGASALAIPRPSLSGDKKKTSSSASVFCLPGHKEDMLVRSTALHLASTFNCVVNVVGGIHIDNASEEDIELLIKNYNICINKLVEHLKSMLS